ncbi:MAG: sensor histidine kinase [Acidimicrobiales bacterium]
MISLVARTAPTNEPPELEGDGRPAVALGVLVVSLALALFSTALTLVVRPEWNINQWFWAVDTVDAVVYGVVAWLVLGRLRHPIAWILAVTAVGGGLAAVGAQWTLLWAEQPDLPELPTVQLLQGTAWVPGTLALIVVLPWLVREGRLDAFSRVMIGLGVALITWTMFVRLTDPFLTPSGEPYSPLAIRSETWEEFVLRSTTWENGLLVALGLVAAGDVWRRRRGLSDADQRAYGWLAVAVAVLSIAFLPLALPEDTSSRLPLAFTPFVHLVSQALYPAAIAGVVLRRRLWGVDLAVRRTLTWWLLSSGLVVTYVVVVSVLGHLLPGDEGFAQVVTTALLAAGFHPVRLRVQRGVDALVHGDARQPGQVVRRLGQTLGDAGDPDELLGGLVEGMASSLRLGGAAITAVTPDGPHMLAATGEIDHRATDIDLVHQQRVVGRLTVGPRMNERLDVRTVQSVEELAPVVAATVALAAATNDLRYSRGRLAEARDEERRVLRRELHDGLGPALAGIGLGLQASRNLLAADPIAATELLDALAGELDARVEEVRGLARGLLPPALEELGLAPALLELAERHTATGLLVEVDVSDLPPVPPEVGSAVYGIVAEAVRNVQRHAGATRCRITADARDGLRLSVADDGVGIDTTRPAGVGTRSMRERAEGVGGSVDIVPAHPHGTEVVVRVPLAALVPGAQP